MRKAYVIADFLSDENKAEILSTAESNGFELSFYESVEDAAGKVSDAEIIYSGGDSSIMNHVPNVKWVHSAFAGIDAYAASGLFDDGKIILTNGSGAYGLTISEHIIMVSLMLLRRMPDYNKIIYERDWVNTLKSRSIAGSKVVIIGTGNIGETTAMKFKAMGAETVIGFNRNGRDVAVFDEVHKLDEFDAIYADKAFADSVDILVLCVPGTSETKGLMSRERIAMLSDKTYVINVGRGASVDQEALIEALNAEKIAGAALDVMTPEPLPKDHPLWDAKNCIVTPHISGNMTLKYTVDKTVEFFCENIKRYVRGEELTNLADVKIGY